MSWFRASRPAPIRAVPAADFDAAARRDGFALDRSQQAAVAALTSAADVYLTGPPGRGKTWLLDVFAEALPAGTTLRMHWHEFVRDLHRLIRRHGGLDAAIDHLVTGRAAVCFDELHVDDPADGIFVDRLLTGLSAHHVRMIVTSNLRPDQLMPNPLFHEMFRPTIEVIERRFTVIELDDGCDYRTVAAHDVGFASGRWSTGSATGRTGSRPAKPVTASISGRRFSAWRADDDVLWVDFAQICGAALGATDYLTLAGRHRRWVIDRIPDLASAGREPALRFVHLVDVLYDHDIPVTFVADVAHTQFGRRGAVPAGTTRLLSRLGTLRSARQDPVEDDRQILTGDVVGRERTARSIPAHGHPDGVTKEAIGQLDI
ncbi:cell division protein ZapE [Gordonia sp. SID5947]|nr:cell division protein ZapE [Gordonia sp. SID5947]